MKNKGFVFALIALCASFSEDYGYHVRSIQRLSVDFLKDERLVMVGGVMLDCASACVTDAARTGNRKSVFIVRVHFQ